MWKKFKDWFNDKINWCSPTLSTGEEKPVSKLVQFYFYTLWPIPWQEEQCWCCASVRGYIQGAVIGFLLAWGVFG